jgi:toxin ParE1/3/4
VTLRIEFLPRALGDLRDAFHWYESQRVGLGSKFLQAVDEVLERVRVLPEGHALAARNTRKVLLPRYPYFLLYAREGERIIVTAVLHTKRHRRNWLGRLRETAAPYQVSA